MATNGLTQRQKEILEFIRSYLACNHYPPAIDEIRVGCGLSSKSLVAYHLTALEQAEVIGRDRGVARGIWLVEQQRQGGC